MFVIKKIFSLLVVCMFLASCTHLTFNERYRQANWDKVIIAPFSGELNFIAEEEFEHKLAVSPKLVIVPASMTKIALKENELDVLYKTDPNKALFDLAVKLNANGIIFANVNSSPNTQSYGGNLYKNTASIFAKLVDINTKSIVASSQYDSSSLISNSNTLVKDVSQKSIEDFELFFDRIVQK